MHYLQKTILDALRTRGPLTYMVMMPDDIESSHFRYHLNALLAAGLVAKDGEGRYALTVQGLQEVDYLSADRISQRRTPKIITYSLLRYGNDVLLYKKPKEPYKDLWGFVGGKVHLGEDMARAAQREVYEKLGLRVLVPRQLGVADIIVHQGEALISHVVAYIHSVTLAKMPLLGDTLMPLAAVVAGDRPCMPDVPPIMRSVSAGKGSFHAHIRCTIDA